MLLYSILALFVGVLDLVISIFPTIHLPISQPDQFLYYWYNTILAIDTFIPIKFAISCIVAIFIIKNGVVIKHIIMTVWHAIRG